MFMPNIALNRIILALDNFNNREDIWDFMKKRGKFFSHVKLGLEFFCKYGPQGIKEFQQEFATPLFLDLKLHDIPNTVSHAIRSLEGINIEFLTIHLSGGKPMVKLAIEESRQYLPHCKILGVSYLTSLAHKDFEELWGIKEDQISNQFQRIFQLALESDIDGVVLSGMELPILSQCEELYKKKIIKVTPGIRFKLSSSQDQQRVLTPQDALSKGADFLVMGRDWTQSDDAKFQQQVNQLKNCH
jgi:orotidine-5'-phosphate decarboxylase